MQMNQDKRTAWSIGFVAAFVALAALVVSFARADDAAARWVWCLGDPKYSVTTPSGESGEIWIEVYFPLDQLENVSGIDVNITVPANISATVDPASLGVFVEGELIEDIAVTGAISQSNETWRKGAVEVDVEATLHAEGSFPVKIKITRVSGDDVRETWRNGQSNEVFFKPDVPIKVQ